MKWLNQSIADALVVLVLAGVCLASAACCAQADDKDLAEWLADVVKEPKKARYIAARNIVQELEAKWHPGFDRMPQSGWEELQKDAVGWSRMKDIVGQWDKWAQENPGSGAPAMENKALNCNGVLLKSLRLMICGRQKRLCARFDHYKMD